MNKKKIVVFGVTEPIIWNVRNKINPLATELVAFVDNDKQKQGYKIGEIPVMGLNDLIVEPEYYFLIAGLSGYESIKSQLMSEGIKEEKIQPLLVDELSRYCIGSLENMDYEFIKIAYFQPELACKRVEEYMKIYREYAQVPLFEKQDDVFARNILISHAGGGVINEVRNTYTNSKEAFEYSVSKGFELIECDLLKVGSEIFAGHDYDTFYRSKQERYTLLKLEELLDWMRTHEKINLLIDVKWAMSEDYEFFVVAIDDYIENIDDAKEKKNLKNRIIMEVYNEETIQMAYNRNFKMFFTQYRNPDKTCQMKIVNLCSKYGIDVVGFFVDEALDINIGKFFNILKRKNIRICCYHTDDIDKIVKLKQMGIDCIFTNHLTVSI